LTLGRSVDKHHRFGEYTAYIFRVAKTVSKLNTSQRKHLFCRVFKR